MPKNKKSTKSIRVVHLHVTPMAELTINPKEFAVLALCVARNVPSSNGDLAGAFGFGAAKGMRAKTHHQAHSWARNCVRRLVRERLIRRVDTGRYEATARGREVRSRDVADVVAIKRSA